MTNATPTEQQRLAMRQRPNRRVIMYQTWRDLLFLHWAVDADAVQRLLPPSLTVDTFEGSAYIGIVPFYMRRIRPRFVPPVPGISWFLETNVRTYVHDQAGNPGVWFFSLDANQRLAVWAARTFWRLPYYQATMQARKEPGGWIDYRTRRRGHPHHSHFRYRPSSDRRVAADGTLEFFLVERYLLFAQTRSGLGLGRVYHSPYQIQSAECPIWSADLLTLAGLDAPQRPPDTLHFSPGVSVDVYSL